MRIITVLFFANALLFCTREALSQAPQNLRSRLGVYDGRTPCQALAKELNKKTVPECIKIKWRLILYQDSLTSKPAGYTLEGFVYKREIPRQGTWSMLKGAGTNPDAIVYRLDADGEEPIFLLKGDDNVLFFMDKERKLMVGNSDFGYTLNRMK